MSTLETREPACTESAGELELIVEGRAREVGTITVARILPAARRRMVGPFTFLDHMGPVTLAPGVGFDVLPHPHIGLSTVTYFLEGENVHRDSLGTEQVNRPGDVNLMTAGRGVVHSERATPELRAHGGRMHGIQMWLALPAAHEEDPPSFAHHPKASLPAIRAAAGVTGRVLIGEAFGARSPIQHPSEPWLVDLELEAGATIAVPADVPERAAFVIEGGLAHEGGVLGPDRLAVLCAGRAATLVAAAPTRLLLVGGPSPGPRYMDWNFVASSRERLAQAKADWQAQRFPRIPGDDREFVPYPEAARTT